MEPSKRHRRSDIHADNLISIAIAKKQEWLQKGRETVLDLECRWGGGWIWVSGRHNGGIFVA